MTFPARTLSDSSQILRTVEEAGADFIAIEEGQFWDDGLVRVAEGLVGKQVVVIINGLNQDYLGRPYSEKAHYLLHTFYTDRKLEMTHTVNQIWNEITMSTMVS